MAKHMREAAARKHATWVRALVAAWVLFIWSRSLFSGPESSAQSGFVVELLRPAFEALGMTDVDLMTFVVRKTAHFSEYAVLGVLLALTHVSGRRAIPWPQALLGVAVAAADESIQLFVPGRSGQPTDVLIDTCGMLSGLAIAALVIRARSNRSNQ